MECILNVEGQEQKVEAVFNETFIICSGRKVSIDMNISYDICSGMIDSLIVLIHHLSFTHNHRSFL